MKMKLGDQTTSTSKVRRVDFGVTLAEEAAASQRRTDARLKRTEGLVSPSADPRLK